MYYPVKKRLLVSDLGNMRSDGSCNIARGGKLTNKIAVDDEQKFPGVTFSEGKKKRQLLRHGNVPDYHRAAWSAVHLSRHRYHRHEVGYMKDCKRGLMGGGPIYQIYERG